jgi:hypothetical protein
MKLCENVFSNNDVHSSQEHGVVTDVLYLIGDVDMFLQNRSLLPVEIYRNSFNVL